MSFDRVAILAYGMLTIILLAWIGHTYHSGVTMFFAAAAAGLTYVFQNLEYFEPGSKPARFVWVAVISLTLFGFILAAEAII